jgi:hypothetical protein
MVLAFNSAQLYTAQIHLHTITTGEDGVSYQFSSILYNTDLPTSYNSRQPEKMVSAINSAQLSTAQIRLPSKTAREKVVSAINSAQHYTAQIDLQAIRAREDGVSHQFNSTLSSTDSFTPYNSRRRWCQPSIQLSSVQYRFTHSL